MKGEELPSAVLDRLLRQREPMTVEALALKLKASRRVVQRALTMLTEAGCEFDHHPQLGVQLQRSGLGAWVDYLDHYAPRPKRVVEVYRRTASTQDAARRTVAGRGPGADGAIIVADEQTAGRGRLGRKWTSEAGEALTLSRVCIHGNRNENFLTLAAAVAVAEALRSAAKPAELNVQIKWPNDVQIDGRKIAGILVERFVESGTAAAAIGIGVNVHRAPRRVPGATSLADAGVEVDRLRVLAELVRQLDDALDRRRLVDLVHRWRQLCVNWARPVRLKHNGHIIEGVVLDLDPNEGLILRTPTGHLVHLPAATTTSA